MKRIVSRITSIVLIAFLIGAATGGVFSSPAMAEMSMSVISDEPMSDCGDCNGGAAALSCAVYCAMPCVSYATLQDITALQIFDPRNGESDPDTGVLLIGAGPPPEPFPPKPAVLS